MMMGFLPRRRLLPRRLFLDDTIIAQKIYHLLSSFGFWTIFASFFTAFFAILYGCASA